MFNHFVVFGMQRLLSGG